MEKRDKNTVFFHSLFRCFLLHFLAIMLYSGLYFTIVPTLTPPPPSLSVFFCFSAHFDALMNATKYTHRGKLENA